MKRMTRRAFLGTAGIAVVSCAVSNPIIAFATPTSAEKKAEAEAVQSKLDSMKEEQELAVEEYNGCVEAHDNAVAAMEEAQARIDAAEATIASLQGHLSTRATAMYRNGSTSFLEVLLGSSSFSEFITTWDVLQELNDRDGELVEETKAARAEAMAAHEEFTLQEAEAQKQLDAAEEAKTVVEQHIANYQAELDSLEAEIAQLIAEEEAARAAAAAAETARAQAAYAQSNDAEVENTTSIPSNGSVVDYAFSRLGCPYVWGATGPNTFDCSGLTSWCYRQAGVSIPRTSSSQRAGADAVLSLSAAEPGDILWKSGHVGIYIGGGQFIHAPTTGDVVRVASNMGMWSCALRFS